MKILDHLAEAAAVLLLMELLVVILIFVAISGGLAYGVRWVRGKTGWASERVNNYFAIGRRYIDRGLDLLAQPVIVGGRLASTVEGTAEAVQRRVRQLRAAREPATVPVGASISQAAPPTVASSASTTATTEPAARPVPRPETPDEGEDVTPLT